MVEDPRTERRRIVEMYRDFVGKGLSRLFDLSRLGVEVEARGMTVTDHRGEGWLEFSSGFGVHSMGYMHPRVVAAVAAQLERQALSSRIFFNPVMAKLAARLAEFLPGDLRYSFFTNSGTEAVEGALKLARLFTGRPGFVAAENAFHGKSLGALSVSGRDIFKVPFGPLLPGVTHVPFGDATALARVVTEETAAVILEPIQGEGGIIVPPDGYLQAARQITEEKGALLILDEVQTGLGRTGTWFACEHVGVVPDIITLGKALGGGIMPIGAFCGRPAVWAAFDANPLIHTSTFGGNPLACAAALAALQVLEEERLPARAAEMGAYLIERLQEVAAAHPHVITAVRGRGLLVGVELAMPGMAGMVMDAMHNHRVSVVHTLNLPKVLRFEPPLIVERPEINRAVAAFAAGVQSVAKKQ